MPLPNSEKVRIIRDALCPPGSSFDKVAALRKAIRTALADTKLGAAGVCDSFVPLEDPRAKEPKRLTDETLSQLKDLLERIEGSTDDYLADIAKMHAWIVI